MKQKRCKRRGRWDRRKNGKYLKRNFDAKKVKHKIPKCGYVIVGASSDTDAKFFTPIIFRQSRGVGSTNFNETIWLSKTPSQVSKIKGASEFSIASLAQLNLAVDKKKDLKSVQNMSKFGKFLWALTKTIRRRNRLKTEWIDILLVNAQLDSVNSEIAMEQLEILLSYIERKQEASTVSFRVILKLGTNSRFSSDLAQLLGTNGYSNAIQTARNKNKAFADKDPAMIWSKGVENILSSPIRNEEKRKENIISAFLYKGSRMNSN